MINVLFIILSFIFTQRWIFGELQSYVCLVPFSLAIYFYLRKKDSNVLTFLIISIFLSIDISRVTQATPFVIRYMIYLFTLFYIIKRTKFDYKQLIIFLIFCINFIIMTLNSLEFLSLKYLYKDIIVLILFFISIFSKDSILQFNEKLLFKFFLIFLVFEALNFFYYFGQESFYLSYDSTKSLVALPLLFLLGKNDFRWLLIFLLFFMVCNMYVTRLIFVVTVFLILYHYLIKIELNYKKLLFNVLLFMIFFTVPIFILDNFERNNKIIDLIYWVFESPDFVILLKNIDFVRYYEGVMFFDRDFTNILLGSGLGVGIYDFNGLTSGLTLKDSAFTQDELNSKIIYNFHDLYSSIGMRFGLIFIVYVFFRVFKTKNHKPSYYFYSSLLLLLCAFYSTAGLILFSIFHLSKNTDNKYSF